MQATTNNAVLALFCVKIYDPKIKGSWKGPVSYIVFYAV